MGLLKKTDPNLLITIARKMVHHLGEHGIKEAECLWELFSSAYQEDREILETNFPYQFKNNKEAIGSLDRVFDLAGIHLDEEDILKASSCGSGRINPVSWSMPLFSKTGPLPICLAHWTDINPYLTRA